MITRLLPFLAGVSSLRFEQHPAGPSDPDEDFMDSFDMPLVDLSDGRHQSLFSVRSVQPETIDAWLIMCHPQQSLAKNMYTPILLTLRAGLAGIGRRAQMMDTKSNQIASVPRYVREAVANGKKPLVFAVAPPWRSTAEVHKAIREAASGGAYVVLYQTEPGASVKMLPEAYKMNASEIWDYSMANIDAYPKNIKGIVVRYMPPGYLADVAGDLTVNMSSSNRREERIGFLGGMNGRPKRIQKMYKTLLGGRVEETNKVWTPEQYAHWIEMYPLQLNTFKYQTCCPRTSAPPMTSFRMSLLLSFRACVVSAPVTPKDAEHYANIVRFAEVEQTGEEVSNIIASGIHNCQSAAHALYKERFRPTRLLEDSGFLAAWKP